MKSVFKLLPVLLIGAGGSSALAATPLHNTLTANPAAVATTKLTATTTGASTTATVNGTVAAGSVSVSQFNTANGILVGATVGVNTAVALNAEVFGTVNATGGGRTVTASSSMTGTVSTAGVSFSTPTALAASRSCSGGNCANSPNNQSQTVTGTIAGSSAVPLANLAAYAGAGTIAFNRSATGSTTVTDGSGATAGSARGTYTFGGAVAANNVYSITYDYLNFANPSFNGTSNLTDLPLDFGTLFQNSGPVTLNFSLFNIGNINSAGLSLTAVNRDTNDTHFTTTAATFVNGLDGGNSLNYSVTFNPVTLGLSHENFALILQDYASGGIGARLYTLNVRAQASVIELPDTVPEPATWAMMIIGFGMVGLARRRAGAWSATV